MREIKTRCWSKAKNKFYYFTGVFNSHPFVERSTFPQYESCKEYIKLEDPQLYTGLKDKNGMEVYEGDVLSFVPIGHKKFNNPFRPFEIFWDEKNARFSDWSPKEGERGAEVIGNIYEKGDEE